MVPCKPGQSLPKAQTAQTSPKTSDRYRQGSARSQRGNTSIWVVDSPLCQATARASFKEKLNVLPPKKCHLSEYLREWKRSVLEADCSIQTSLRQAKDDKEGVESHQAICISIGCCRESRTIKKKQQSIKPA